MYTKGKVPEVKSQLIDDKSYILNHLAKSKIMKSDGVKMFSWKFSSCKKGSNQVGQRFPSEEIIPKPNEPEILPDPNLPEEEEYLPGEEENPKREIEDPNQPDREQDFPPKREEEKPQEEPRRFRAEFIPPFLWLLFLSV